MKRVMKQLENQMATYAKAPFFAFLSNPEIDPREKLAFTPHVAHFVLTFGDLCAFLLKEEPAVDKYQALVNANCREDEGHWRWYLTDLGTLDRDPSIPYSEAIKVIWNDTTVRTRKLSYHLAHLALGSDSLGKLVLVHCIEAAFQATVKDLGPATRAYTEVTGKNLVYLGARHEGAETSHTLEDTAVRQEILAIELESNVAANMCRMVDECFVLFTAFTDEMLALAKMSVHERA